MDTPKIFDKKPFITELEAGKYSWCPCGLAKEGAFCDKAHKGTSFKSLKFELEEKKKVAICMCKHTKNAPFCDGTHKSL